MCLDLQTKKIGGKVMPKVASQLKKICNF